MFKGSKDPGPTAPTGSTVLNDTATSMTLLHPYGLKCHYYHKLKNMGLTSKGKHHNVRAERSWDCRRSIETHCWIRVCWGAPLRDPLHLVHSSWPRWAAAPRCYVQVTHAARPPACSSSVSTWSTWSSESGAEGQRRWPRAPRWSRLTVMKVWDSFSGTFLTSRSCLNCLVTTVTRARLINVSGVPVPTNNMKHVEHKYRKWTFWTWGSKSDFLSC